MRSRASIRAVAGTLLVVVTPLAPRSAGVASETASQASGWQAQHHLSSQFTDVSCASATFCVATTPDGAVRMYNGHTWTAEQVITKRDASMQVSCPSTTFCLAMSGGVDQYAVYENGRWGEPGAIADGQVLLSLSCASGTFCVTGTFTGQTYYFDGTSWSGGPPAGSGVHSFSCVSSTFCMAENAGGLVAVFDGSSWGDYVNTGVGNGVEVSCVSTDFCAVSGPRHKVAVYGHGRWKRPVKLQTGHHGGITGLSCATASFCAAVDWDGRSYLYDGLTWTLSWMRSRSFHDHTSISCATASFCAAVDIHRYITFYRGA